MTPITIFAEKKVAVFGLGGSGLISASALLAGGADVVAFDDDAATVERAAAAGIPIADLRAVDWSKIAALVLTPGVPLTHPAPHWVAALARAAGVEIVGDVELFGRERAARAPSAPFVAITGTNGKSTTTALAAHILRTAGRDVQMGGNIGVAILSLEPPAPDRVHVVEVSSYQIDLAPTLAPTVGILLNVTPDHLDRHGTMENYAAIKERAVTNADTAVIAVDDVYTRAAAARREASGRPT
ncbi:MAG: Mur ligase family protein, partial [Xanthobacteraceae bacterium]